MAGLGFVISVTSGTLQSRRRKKSCISGTGKNYNTSTQAAKLPELVVRACAVLLGAIPDLYERRVMAGPIKNPDASPRERIIIAAKHMMSAVGYENTTTDAICSEAGVSQAQLTKHFGTKEALLEAIFEQGWAKLRMQMPLLQTVQSPRRRLKMLLHFLTQLFSEDRQLRDLMLLEGRRIRRESKMVILTASYTGLVSLLDSLIQADFKGSAPAHQVQLVRSSLIGMFEGLLRDVVLHERFSFPAEFSAEEVEQYVAEIVDRLLTPLRA